MDVLQIETTDTSRTTVLRNTISHNLKRKKNISQLTTTNSAHYIALQKALEGKLQSEEMAKYTKETQGIKNPRTVNKNPWGKPAPQ